MPSASYRSPRHQMVLWMSPGHSRAITWMAVTSVSPPWSWGVLSSAPEMENMPACWARPSTQHATLTGGPSFL